MGHRTQEEFPVFMTVPEVAQLLKVPASTVHHWATRGEGPPSFKVGKHRRFDAEQVRQWLERVRTGAA